MICLIFEWNFNSKKVNLGNHIFTFRILSWDKGDSSGWRWSSLNDKHFSNVLIVQRGTSRTCREYFSDHLDNFLQFS